MVLILNNYIIYNGNVRNVFIIHRDVMCTYWVICNYRIQQAVPDKLFNLGHLYIMSALVLIRSFKKTKLFIGVVSYIYIGN